VAAGEELINQIGQSLAREQMSFASSELKKATDRYQAAKSKTMAFQERNRMMDPSAQAKANSMLTVELQARLSRLEADVRAAQSYMDENSYQVRAMRQQAEALREQLSLEAARGTVESKKEPRLNVLAGEFRELEIELNFAEQAFKSATLTMETARLESIRKMKTLVLVASPTKPQDPAYPRRAYDVLAWTLAFSLIFGICRLIVATIEDHLD
jgi:capsular polysaccharide transport system permease protein